MGPLLPARHESGANGIVENVACDGEKRVAIALVFAKNMIERLLLSIGGREMWAHVLAEKLHGHALIGVMVI
jgi:hypothetical protein